MKMDVNMEYNFVRLFPDFCLGSTLIGEVRNGKDNGY